MKLVLSTKLSRYKDWYETTDLDAKELIKMIEILQFLCYFKFGMGLYKLMCKN